MNAGPSRASVSGRTVLSPPRLSGSIAPRPAGTKPSDLLLHHRRRRCLPLSPENPGRRPAFLPTLNRGKCPPPPGLVSHQPWRGWEPLLSPVGPRDVRQRKTEQICGKGGEVRLISLERVFAHNDQRAFDAGFLCCCVVVVVLSPYNGAAPPLFLACYPHCLARRCENTLR